MRERLTEQNQSSRIIGEFLVGIINNAVGFKSNNIAVELISIII
jgi:hypothetical protein